jgi:hypothetical protein
MNELRERLIKCKSGYIVWGVCYDENLKKY